MCGRFTLAAKLEEIGRHFQVEAELEGYQASYNIAPSLNIPVVWFEADSGRRLSWMRWGLIPHWAKEAHTKYRMINAKAETLGQKPAYRQAYRHRRCLIPADGFYEWKQEEKGKQPYFLHMGNNGLFAFGGLWERWEDDQQSIHSCTIVTTKANDAVKGIHDRMPVIINPEHYAQWLDPNVQSTDALSALLQAGQHAPLQAHAVSKQVNKPENDSPDLILRLPDQT